MISIEEMNQLKAFARQDALLLGAVWIASFAFVVMAPESIFGSLLALASPFVVGWRLGRFRDVGRDGIISFRRGYGYSVYTFLYASLLFALAQYLYFRFIDGGTFLQMLNDSVTTFGPLYEQYGLKMQDLQQALAGMQSLSAVQWAFMLMMQNFFIGFILSIPIAAICARKTKTVSGS